MTARVSVMLAGPAKIDGRFRQPGEMVEVEPGRLAALAAAGAIRMDGADALPALAPGGEGYDQAVVTMAKAISDAAVAAAVETATSELIADRDFWRREAENAEAARRALEAASHELEAEIADLNARLAAKATTATTAPDVAPAPAADPKPAAKRATSSKG